MKKSLFIFFIAMAALVVFSAYLLQQSGKRIKAAPGVPALSFAIEPELIHPGENFDLIIKVNPNDAVFNAFELYSNYDPTLVDFQDTNDISGNFRSPYILINSSADPGAGLITIIGTTTGGGFTGNIDMEIARIRMRVGDAASGEMIFAWDQNTRLGNKIRYEALNSTFSITPAEEITPTDVPLPTNTRPISGLSFKVKLPDVLAENISLADVSVELRDGETVTDTANVNLLKEGDYYGTGSPVEFTHDESKNYQVFVKTSISLGRLFSGVNLTPGLSLNCKDTDNPACGELISGLENRQLESGDSDGFNTASGSYNRIDSADLQTLNQYFNIPVSGAGSAGDFNLDGEVNISDLEIIGKNYGLAGD